MNIYLVVTFSQAKLFQLSMEIYLIILYVYFFFDNEAAQHESHKNERRCDRDLVDKFQNTS